MKSLQPTIGPTLARKDDVPIRHDDVISGERVLKLLLERRRPLSQRTSIFVTTLIVPPTVIVVVASFTDVLTIENGVGLLDDYLFVSFAFIFIPLLVVLLDLVINRFVVFATQIRSFTEKLNDDCYDYLVRHLKDGVNGQGLVMTMALYGVAGISLLSNLNAVYFREAGWNSSEYPVLFGLTAMYLLWIIVFVARSLFAKYLFIIIAQIKVTKFLVENRYLSVQPISPDRCGGLKSLGDLSLGYTLFLLPLAIILVIHHLTWDTITIGSVLGLVGFLPLACFVFFYPLGVVHNAMLEAKVKSMRVVSRRYTEIDKKIQEMLADGTQLSSVLEKKQLVDFLEASYQRIDRMPVWPFNVQVIGRFLAICFGPLSFLIVERLIHLLF